MGWSSRPETVPRLIGKPLKGRRSPYTSYVMDKFYPLIEHYRRLIVFFGVMLAIAGIPFLTAAVLLASSVLAQQGHLHLEVRP